MNKSVLTQMNSAQTSQEKVQSVRMFEHNFLKDSKYFQFRITHWNDSDKFKLSSFFVSIRDEARYQASDRSGTDENVSSDVSSLCYDESFEHRQQIRRAQMDDNSRRSFLREQFDSISKDFISCLYVDELFLMQLQSESLNKFQKWWCLFGKYWVIKNCYNNDDIKKMKWLMNGANRGTVDTSSENV